MGDRIIPAYKYSVQTLKGAPASYTFAAGISAGWLAASYIPREGLFGSYIQVVPTVDAGGPAASYILGPALAFGWVSVSYIPLQTLLVSYILPLAECSHATCTTISRLGNYLPSADLEFVLLALGTTYQAGFEEFDELENDAPSIETSESELNSGSDGDNTATDDNDKPEKWGLPYLRVSKEEQAEEGHSLETQIAELKQLAEERGISLVSEPIVDRGLTGRNFERDGIKRVFRLASSGQFNRLLVQHVDRIGRTTAQTLYFIHILQTECDVRILTPTGELDVTDIQGLIETTMKALMSEVAAMGRGKKANNTVVHRFMEQKQWSSRYQLVPFGYRETDDGWIEPQPDEIEIVQDIFAHFLESESYAATRRYINEEYNDELDRQFARSQIKRLLKRPVYIGEPTICVRNIKEDTDELCKEDPDLQIIDRKTFDRVQTVVDRIYAKYSTDEDTVDVDSLVDEFGLFPVIENSPVVRVVCPDCQEVMVKNGQRDLNGEFNRHNYLCNSCGQQRTFPKLSELGALKNTNP